jgi:acetyltransferase
VDVAALARIVVRFSRLVVEEQWIKEIVINPLIASAGELVALDARIILHPPHLDESDLPRPAIRSYPAHYTRHYAFEDGTEVLLRPIRTEDEPMMIRFHLTLMDSSVYLRYFHTMKLEQRIAHERLTRRCFIDYDREIALVAELTDPARPREMLGVARMKRSHGANEAEIAVIVSDACHNCGLASRLVDCLTEIGRQEKLDRLVAVMLAENLAMQHVLKKAGYAMRTRRKTSWYGRNCVCEGGLMLTIARILLPVDFSLGGVGPGGSRIVLPGTEEVRTGVLLQK